MDMDNSVVIVGQGGNIRGLHDNGKNTMKTKHDLKHEEKRKKE